MITREMAIAAGCCAGGVDQFIRWLGTDAAEPAELVRRLLSDPRPDAPYWRAMVAIRAPGLSAEQRFDLGLSMGTDRAYIAIHAPDLSASQRIALVVYDDDGDRAAVAIHAPGLSADQRFDLGRRCRDECDRAEVAIRAPGLMDEQRFMLAMSCTERLFRRAVASLAPMGSEYFRDSLIAVSM